MNLLEAMRVYVAVVERGGLSGAASELRLDEAQVSERIDCLERYLGCRLLLCREHDDVACSDAGVAFHVCCRRTLSAVEQAIGAAGPHAPAVQDALDAADAPDVPDSGAVHAAARDAAFPPPGAVQVSSTPLSP
ncbi:LysR family transcriptional regulator [Burkholderia cepacia]|uniref:LysR family transcriptional regulator n=1 Tax=Burkholderia cepacia TaxID=292 RepID=A0ABN5D277_BURCE|nr:LysR family transcriptional regulator [Burkholderia cepacia]AIO26887.1 bacterial regulatory helix-turn-helix, lysR family protein [Burkholderia cepacia ATCC 25416]ALK23373.1 LysR family transcriptional regulator [Burkholderia cepacia ATCC 25416]ASE92560.1 LysR family transcriptional regulator [Burkholderia cepacia]ATF80420.1 LysR family transcriptional regulator [Burkholderia cepacia]MCA8470054.1 LysR family transcriptional regulator [Burkholderia cepacia]